MGPDLLLLSVNYLKNCTFDEAKTVIDEMEKVNVGELDKISVIEDLEKLYSDVNELIKRVNENSFPELETSKADSPTKKRKVKAQKNELLTRLKAICSRFVTSLEINNTAIQVTEELSKTVEKHREELEKEFTDRFNADKAEREKALQSYNADLKKSLIKYRKKIDDSEHNILSHVLTLMGVFTAITTIIISAATTSSEWLSSANESQAFLVFVIPNLVTLLTVTVLLSLVFWHQNHDNPFNIDDIDNNDTVGESNESKENTGKNKESADESFINVNDEKLRQTSKRTCYKTKNKRRFNVYIFLCSTVFAICILIAVFAFRYLAPKSPTHVRIILKYGQYETTKEYDKLTESVEYFYKFRIDNKEYEIPYDKKYLHEKELHFCEIHNALE